MAEPFPENEVEVMPSYITPALLQTLPGVRQELFRIILTDRTIEDTEENAPAIAVNESRIALRAFLHDPRFQRAFFKEDPESTTLPVLDEIYFTIRSRKRFGTALALLATLPEINGFPFITRDALRRQTIRCTVMSDDLHPTSILFSLQGFRDPALTQTQKAQLAMMRDLLTGNSTERRFRRGLLVAETHFGLREFEAAIQDYDDILREPDTPQSGVTRRKFLAIRSGFAHLGRGDQLYQSTRELSSDLAAEAIAHYREAVKIVQDHGVSESNEFHQDIKDYADKRMTQLSSSINFLGFSNAYVPAGPSFGGLNDTDSMLGLARTRVGAAQRVRDAFVNYLQAAEQAQLAVAEAENAIREAAVSIEVANARRTQTRQRKGAASARLKSVTDKNGLLKAATFRDVVIGAAAITVAAAAAGPAAGVVIVAGAISFGAKTHAGLEELTLEEQLAGFDLRIAESEGRIADLEVRGAESRMRYLQDKRDFLSEGAELNVDVYYALAREYERLTEEHMQAAIRLAFLAERRAAFERGDPTLPRVRFEYLKPAHDLGVGGLIIAPDFLDRDLLLLNEAFQQGGQSRTDFDFQISLRAEYPIEFSSFLQSGVLPFKISLYDLERFRPGLSDQRIKTVHIEIVGLGAALPNVSGRLRHSGTFMVRDRASAADAERLLPTPRELDDALNSFRQGSTSTVTTKGITLWQVDPREKELTNLQDDPDIEEFTDFGFTGVWEFELRPSENPDINVRNIADVIIRINGSAIQGDPEFRAHIRELVRAYEKEQQPEGQNQALDRVAALSMKTSFLRDAFADLLATGSTTFKLEAGTFPDDNVAGTKVKAVLFQAIDEEGRGVEALRLIVSKEGASTSVDRTTLANGFSEDINIDIPFLERSLRFAMEGFWGIEAADVTRLSSVKDLIVFFMYELPQGAGDE